MYKSDKNLAEHEVNTKKVRIVDDESGNVTEEVVEEKVEETPEEEYDPLHPKNIKRDILKETQQSENPEPVALTAGQKFFIAMDKFGDFFILNILFSLLCIPIVTIGAAVTAMYSVFIKMVKNQEGIAKNDFIKAFKKNFWPATKVWLVLLVIIGVLYVQYIYVIDGTSQASQYLMICLGFELLIVSLMLPFLFPFIARYENTTFNYFKNAFIVALMNIKEWLKAFLLFALPVLIYYVNPKLFIITGVLWLVILFSIVAYAKTVVMWKIYDKLESKPTTKE